jgi:hypothetical protein
MIDNILESKSLYDHLFTVPRGFMGMMVKLSVLTNLSGKEAGRNAADSIRRIWFFYVTYTSRTTYIFLTRRQLSPSLSTSLNRP